MLLDCWIISKNLSNEYSDKFLKILSKYVLHSKSNLFEPTKGLQELEIKFLKVIREKKY